MHNIARRQVLEIDQNTEKAMEYLRKARRAAETSATAQGPYHNGPPKTGKKHFRRRAPRRRRRK